MKRKFLAFVFMIVVLLSISLPFAMRYRDRIPVVLEVIEHRGMKTTIRRDGDYRGEWVEDHRCVMGVCSASPIIPSSFDEVFPFIVVYVKDDGGVTPRMPYGLNFQNGELLLQIPNNDANKTRLVPMSRIVELIENDESERREHRPIFNPVVARAEDLVSLPTFPNCQMPAILDGDNWRPLTEDEYRQFRRVKSDAK